MKQPLKTAVQDKLQEKQLNTTQLHKLTALQTQYAKNTPVAKQGIKKTSRQLIPLYAIAATVLLLFSIVLVKGTLSVLSTETTQQEIFMEIVDEVVKNHLQRKPLELKTQHISEIQRYFDQLNFRPIESQILNDMASLDLLGGRYCSIQGITAAQLRFKSHNKESTQTLYQVPYKPKIFKYIPNIDAQEVPITRYSKGIKVTLWQEKGLLFALTTETE